MWLFVYLFIRVSNQQLAKYSTHAEASAGKNEETR